MIALRTCRRSGPVAAAASRARSPRRAARRQARATRRARAPAPRTLVPLPAPTAPARAPDALSRLDAPARKPRRSPTRCAAAHLLDGLPWSAMAVLVRRRSARCRCCGGRWPRPGSRSRSPATSCRWPRSPAPGRCSCCCAARCGPATLDEEAAAELLTGPLGGTDALGLRRLRRALRRRAGRGAGEPPSAASRWPRALRDRRELLGVRTRAAARGRRRGSPACWRARGRMALAPGGTAHDVLWAVWQRVRPGPAWQAASAAGGSRGAVRRPRPGRGGRAVRRGRPVRDPAAAGLDRGCSWTAWPGRRSPATPWPSAPRDGDAVRMLTAHRAKGLEWDLVVVAGVQEGTWPDLRMRGSLLGMDELVDAAARPRSRSRQPRRDAAAAALASKLLDEERRLFYVAVTRARRALVGHRRRAARTAEERPSRFLDRAGRPTTSRSSRSPGPSRAGCRCPRSPPTCAGPPPTAAGRGRSAEAAAAQLARLAAAGVRGAHPGQWYALTELSDAGPVTAATSCGCRPRRSSRSASAGCAGCWSRPPGRESPGRGRATSAS